MGAPRKNSVEKTTHFLHGPRMGKELPSVHLEMVTSRFMSWMQMVQHRKGSLIIPVKTAFQHGPRMGLERDNIERIRATIEAEAAGQTRLEELGHGLATLFADADHAKFVVAEVGLDLEQIDYGKRAVDYWEDILTEAQQQQKLEALVQAARACYPYREWLEDLPAEHLGVPREVSLRLVPGCLHLLDLLR